MRTVITFTSVLVAQASLAGTSPCSTMSSELRRMKDVDQAVRALVRPEDMTSPARTEADAPRSIQRMLLVDRKHEAAFARLIRSCGWPRRSTHGEEATGAAWILVQHARPEIQKEFLPLLERAVFDREVSGSDLAYLTDRVRVGNGLRQLYGTQLDIKGPCEVSVLPIEGQEGVDKRREQMGMPSLEVYLAAVRRHLAERGCAPR